MRPRSTAKDSSAHLFPATAKMFASGRPSRESAGAKAASGPRSSIFRFNRPGRMLSRQMPRGPGIDVERILISNQGWW